MIFLESALIDAGTTPEKRREKRCYIIMLKYACIEENVEKVCTLKLFFFGTIKSRHPQLLFFCFVCGLFTFLQMPLGTSND
jgi:hypothetical protein